MTLDIRKLMKNVIDKQFKISHLDAVESQVFNTPVIPEDIVASIKQSYGDEYLDDAKYVAFFKTPGQFDKKLRKRLFKAVDSALGNDANRLTDGDFKNLELGKTPDPESAPVENPDEQADDTSEINPDNDADVTSDEIADAPNGDEVADALDEAKDQDEPEDDGDEPEDKPEDEDGKSDEDDEEDDVQDKIDPSLPKTAVFLKITTK